MRLSHCGNCGKPLDGRQVMWCSPGCANSAWQKEHREERNEYERNRRAGNKPPTKVEALAQQVTALEQENRMLKGQCIVCATPLKPGQVMYCSPAHANEDTLTATADKARVAAKQKAALTAAHANGGSK